MSHGAVPCSTGRSLGKSLFLCPVHSGQSTPNGIVPKTRQTSCSSTQSHSCSFAPTEAVGDLPANSTVESRQELGSLASWTSVFSPQVHCVFSGQPHQFGSKVSVWV